MSRFKHQGKDFERLIGFVEQMGGTMTLEYSEPEDVCEIKIQELSVVPPTMFYQKRVYEIKDIIDNAIETNPSWGSYR